MSRVSRALSLSLLVAPVGCGHTYVFGGAVPPTIVGKELVVPRASSRYGPEVVGERFEIESIAVADPLALGGWRLATSPELESLRLGVLPEGVDVVRVRVDNSEVVWGEWAATGFGVGAGTVAALLMLSGVVQPGDGGDGMTFPLAMLFATLVGVEFSLIGAALGAGFEGDETDLRLWHERP